PFQASRSREDDRAARSSHAGPIEKSGRTPSASARSGRSYLFFTRFLTRSAAALRLPLRDELGVLRSAGVVRAEVDLRAVRGRDVPHVRTLERVVLGLISVHVHVRADLEAVAPQAATEQLIRRAALHSPDVL